VYFGALAIYIVLSIAFIADVLRQPATELSVAGKVLWILALIFAPVLAWIVYGFWRMRQQRGLA
jgi:hypothetical protein